MRRALAFLLGFAGLASGCQDPRSATGAPTSPSSPAPGGGGPAASSPAALPKTEEEWKKALTPEQYRVCRKKGTERAFTGAYWDTKTKGVYRCVACGQELFGSEQKYDSGTGWPSYRAPIAPDRVGTEVDRSLFSERIEVHCARCGSHLGHVFDDGPEPTGKRYCINSVALRFEESK